MDSETRERVARTLELVFGQFAFMFIEPDGMGEELMGDEFYDVSIGFSGPVKGTVRVAAPGGLCSELAANVLAVDADDADAEVGQDALKEVVNIVCGTLVAELYGTEAVFELTIPELVAIDAEAFKAISADEEALLVWVEDEPVVTRLSAEQ